MSDSLDRSEIVRDFHAAVNMTPPALEKWLDTDHSREVGDSHTQGGDGGESTGHRSGRKIIAILGKKQADLTDADLAHMRKVAGYVHRHMAQRPEGDVSETKWRYSLMNWGHDPLKK
ncbi:MULTISPECIES: DUF3140 domain-containing protein [Sphingomonas]|uniref:DUF3140 domain-containing protein n=1 Tax=Sphingomonas TaxID=13687 RepID=UPI000DEF5AEC|nr:MULTISPECIES: DUF3140 domain-containing protein [Sphingomonas]